MDTTENDEEVLGLEDSEPQILRYTPIAKDNCDYARSDTRPPPFAERYAHLLHRDSLFNHGEKTKSDGLPRAIAEVVTQFCRGVYRMPRFDNDFLPKVSQALILGTINPSRRRTANPSRLSIDNDESFFFDFSLYSQHDADESCGFLRFGGARYVAKYGAIEAGMKYTPLVYLHQADGKPMIDMAETMRLLRICKRCRLDQYLDESVGPVTRRT